MLLRTKPACPCIPLVFKDLTTGSNIASNPYVLISWAWKSAHKYMFVRDELNCGGKSKIYNVIYSIRIHHNTIESEVHFFQSKTREDFLCTGHLHYQSKYRFY